jgi:trimeric autotransporter adhesin
MEADHLYTVAGTGACGSSARGGAAPSAEVDDPVAVAVDATGDLFIADRGDDDVLEVPVATGKYYGTSIGADDLDVIVGMGGNGPYLEDGLFATSEASELNDPEGVAVGKTGTLFITDGAMHCLRVVPSITSDVFGKTMGGGDMYTLAGALTFQNASGSGNGTRWIRAHMDVPVGVAVTASGRVYFSDRGLDQVRELQ